MIHTYNTLHTLHQHTREEVLGHVEQEAQVTLVSHGVVQRALRVLFVQVQAHVDRSDKPTQATARQGKARQAVDWLIGVNYTAHTLRISAC